MKEKLIELFPIITKYFTFRDESTESVTSSEANYLCERSKNKVFANSVILDNLSPFKELITVKDKTMSDKREPVAIESLIIQKASMMAINGWFRTMIKLKEDLILKLESMSNEFLIPEPEPFTTSQPRYRPKLVPKIDEKDILFDLGVKKLCDYFTCEAFAAHVGMYIHPEGAVWDLRKRYYESPRMEIRNAGTEIICVSREELYTGEEIERLYSELESEHRAAEQKLNSHKANIKNMMREEQSKTNQKYLEENIELQAKYDYEWKEYNTLLKKHQDEMANWTLSCSTMREHLLNLLAGMRIVVPNEFKGLITLLRGDTV